MLRPQELRLPLGEPREREPSGRSGLIFDCAKLRARLNHAFASGEIRVAYGDVLCNQMFSLSYVIVTYEDCRLTVATTPNLRPKGRYDLDIQGTLRLNGQVWCIARLKIPLGYWWSEKS